MYVSVSAESRLARRVRQALVVAAAAAVMSLTLATPALAVSLSAPTVTFGTIRCVVKLASTDPTGTLTLMRDGRPWDHKPVTPGSTMVFPDVALRGVWTHAVAAVVTTGTTTISSRTLKVRVYAWPRQPELVGIDSSRLTGRKLRIKVRVSADVTLAELFLNGKYVYRVRVTPGKVNDLGQFAMASSRNSIGVRLGNPAGYRPTMTWRLGRFTYPPKWSTCIVVIKSQLRLYWIRNDILVKSYPVATGRPSLPTPSGYWRIDMKYRTSPSSVFGPRKMRLFRLRGGSFVYTNYNLHGTNTESSIGTYASHGCIRMHNHDILELFPQVPLHTLVQTR